MDKRFFTVLEANELIPFLTERLRQLHSIYKGLKLNAESHTPKLQDVLVRGGIPVDLGYLHLIGRLQGLTSEICSQGCQIKDVENGLVDFPTIWEGREVYLCWKLGEQEVSFWHEIDAGVAGRQPLKNDPRT
ncbi:MAG TPA: DUF2203 domain-containing protein [Vicinamibacteria bacterium]|nr:DUF2203 domain-containing protein [Vicinamibacteria bacterium]